MKKNLLCVVVLVCYQVLMATTTVEWQSQYSVGKGKVAPHTYIFPYDSSSDIARCDFNKSKYFLSLDGKWKFNWVRNPNLRPKDFYKPEFYVGHWNDITVPGNWERQGYGVPIYVNQDYEFAHEVFKGRKTPPQVPFNSNEVGSYRREFEVPAEYQNK